MIELVVFLGNPGREYERTRHNAPWILADRIPFCSSLNWQKKYRGLYASVETGRLLPSEDPAGADGGADQNAPDAQAAPGLAGASRKIHLLKPETYMNISGESAVQAAAFFKVKAPSILVVHDELELPLGVVSFKFGGGLGGHRGLRSLKASLGSADFWRLRIGIGRPDSRRPGEGGPPGSGEGIVDWVLSPFGPAETPLLDETLRALIPAFSAALLRGPESLLPAWAKRKVIEE
ncbi:MAG: aminoacyl-tRNA hydrolase [Treponema sp.]|nr:aminoacyl-tRNA hydrolase [Treponema sp.]